MQRIVGSFVGSAYGAGQFYSRAVTEAAISPRSFPTIPEMRTSTALLASTAEPSASASSQPIWACRPTCFEWPPKVLSRLTRTSQAKPGSLTSARSSSLPTRSTDKPPLPRCQHSNSRMRGFGPAFHQRPVPSLQPGSEKEKRADGKPRPIKCEGHGPPEGNSCCGGTGRSRHVHQLKPVCPNFHRVALNFCAVQLCVLGLKERNPVFWHHFGALFGRTLPGDQRRLAQPMIRGDLIQHEGRNVFARDGASAELVQARERLDRGAPRLVVEN